MACSKLFSGNLPELTYEIIQYFRNDFSTLYSCILVNRLWCCLAIPLLWEDPFSSIHIQNFQFVEIYLHSLNDDDKARLNAYGIDNNLLPSSTLFNYPSFIKRLNTHEVGYSIENWLLTLMDKNHSDLERTAKLVYRLLFKLYIENEGNLHSFEVKFKNYIYFNDTIELTLQNPNFICNISNLILHTDSRYGSTNILPLLKFLYSNCNSISSFYVRIFEIKTANFSLTEKYLSQMIISQQNLKELSIECNIFLYDSFSSLKISNISNTLKIITFYSINFDIIITNFQEIFNQLNVLESIHIINCNSLNSVAQQIINVTKSFRLKTLILGYDCYHTLQVELLQLLLQNIGNDLENFGFGCYKNYTPVQKNQLLKSFVKYCTKIKYFDLGEFNNNININLVLNLIENIKQNLNYLIIEYTCRSYSINHRDICSIVLNNLGQVLPSKLEFLRLCLDIEPSDLKLFLENSQNTFIKRLFIRNLFRDEGEDILPYIKEYIMKKKRVKYLAVCNEDDDLVFIKDEVNEFKLHNIKIIGYYKSYDLIDNYYISNKTAP